MSDEKPELDEIIIEKLDGMGPCEGRVPQALAATGLGWCGEPAEFIVAISGVEESERWAMCRGCALVCVEENLANLAVAR